MRISGIRGAIALGLAAMLTMSACGSDEAAAPSAGTTGAAPATAASGGTTGPAEVPAGDKTTVTLWLAGEADTPEALTTWLTDKFNADHPGATLAIEHIAWGELLPRLTTSLGNADQTPDLVEIGNTQSATFTSVGAFADLTAKMADLGGDKVGPKSFLEAGAFDGKQYAVPYYWGSRYIFYNKKAYADAGVAVPTTLAEFNAAATTLQAKKPAGKDSYSGFWLPGQDWRNGISWIFANGGDIAALEGDKWVGKLSTPESIKGLTELQAIYNTGTSAPKDGTDAEPWTTFNNGEAAAFIAPSWAKGSIAPELADQVGVFPLPGVDGGAAPVFAGGSNLAISAKSTKQDLAFDVLKDIYSADYQTLMAKNGLGPALSEYTSLMGSDEYAKAAVEAATNSKLTPASPKWAAVESSKLMEDFFGKLATGGDVTALAAEFDGKLAEALN